jgi:hypothetical protein
MKDHPVNNWLRTRNSWTLFLVLWGFILVCGLLGTVTVMIIRPHPSSSFASRLPWVVGGSLLMALCAVGSARYRRRRGGSGDEWKRD